MANQDIELMAHLMRRAGFGATRDELETRAAQGYEATVEELLNPETVEGPDRLDFLRYQPGFWKPPTSAGMGGAIWLNDMVNTQRVLQERWSCSGTTFSPRDIPRLTITTKSSSRLTCSGSRGWATTGNCWCLGQRPGHDLLAGQL